MSRSWSRVLKLRTVRSSGLLAIAQVLLVVGISGTVRSLATLSASDARPRALGHVGLTSLIILVLGIIAWPASTATGPSPTPTSPAPRPAGRRGQARRVHRGRGPLRPRTPRDRPVDHVWWTAKECPSTRPTADCGRPPPAGCLERGLRRIGVGLGALHAAT